MFITDLSHWNFPPGVTEPQLELALSRAKAAGLVAVLWKCTEAVNYIDDTYSMAQAVCKKLSILFGAYHFLRRGDPVGQAQFFLGVANPDAKTLVALDF